MTSAIEHCDNGAMDSEVLGAADSLEESRCCEGEVNMVSKPRYAVQTASSMRNS